MPKKHCQGKQPVLVKVCQLRGGRDDKQQLLRFEMSRELSTGGRRFTKLLLRLHAPRWPSAASRYPSPRQATLLCSAVRLLSQTTPPLSCAKLFVIDGIMSPPQIHRLKP